MELTEDYSKLKRSAENGDLMAYYVLFAGSFKQAYYICQNAAKNNAAAIELCADAYALSYINLSKLGNPYGFQIWINYLAAYDASYCLGGGGVSKYLPSQFVLESAADNMQIDPDIASKTWTLAQQKIALINKRKALSSVPGHSAVISPGQNASDRLIPSDKPLAGLSDNASSSFEKNKATQETSEQANSYKLEKKKKNKVYGSIAAILAVCIAIGSAALGEKLKRPETDYSEKKSLSEEKVNRIAALLSGQLAGHIGEVYQISEDTYYLVIYVGGEETDGALAYYDEESGKIKLISENPQNADGITQTDTTQELGKGYLSLKFSSSGASGGVQGNVDYILEEAIASSSTQELIAQNNKIGINGDIIKKITEKAEDERSSMEQFFELNEDGSLNIILRLRCLGVDFSKPFEITLDSAISDLIGKEGELQIVINDDRHVITVTMDQLSQLCSAYGSVTMSVLEIDCRTFDIEFFDDNETLLLDLFGDMKFMFPADDVLTYVSAQCPGGNFAKSGTYNENFETMSFPVWSSGVYTMMTNRENQ